MTKVPYIPAMPKTGREASALEKLLAESIAAVKAQHVARGIPPPIGVILHPRDTPGALSLALGAYAPAEISEVKHAVTEGRLVRGSLPKGGRVVERVVVTAKQLAEHQSDGYEALFRWEEEQRRLGRTVLFHDDVINERLIFEAREET